MEGTRVIVTLLNCFVMDEQMIAKLSSLNHELRAAAKQCRSVSLSARKISYKPMARRFPVEVEDYGPTIGVHVTTEYKGLAMDCLPIGSLESVNHVWSGEGYVNIPEYLDVHDIGALTPLGLARIAATSNGSDYDMVHFCVLADEIDPPIKTYFGKRETTIEDLNEMVFDCVAHKRDCDCIDHDWSHVFFHLDDLDCSSYHAIERRFTHYWNDFLYVLTFEITNWLISATKGMLTALGRRVNHGVPKLLRRILISSLAFLRCHQHILRLEAFRFDRYRDVLDHEQPEKEDEERYLHWD
jgi:hypothetical protein